MSVNNFVFLGLQDSVANVGLFISEQERHDFLMSKDEILSNINKFGSHPELEKAILALENTAQ